MKNKNATWRMLVALLLVLGLIAAACGSDDDEDASTPEAPAPASDDGADDDGDAPAATAAPADDASDDGAAADDDGDADDGAGADDGDADEPAEDAAPALISDECPIPNPEENVEIDVIGWEFPIVVQYADELEECAEGNYTFNVQFLDSAQATEQMNLDLATGNPNFEIIQASNNVIGELANQGYLYPLNDLIEKYRDQFDLDQVDPAFLEMGSVDGNIYTIPMVSNTLHTFYNQAIFDELGVDVPDTFDELFDLCPVLQDAGYDTAYGMRLSSPSSWYIHFDSVISSLGLRSTNPDGTTNWETPEALEAVNILVRILEECSPLNGSYSVDDVQAGLQTAEIPLGYLWASRAGAMDDPEASTVVGDIAYAPALGSTPGGVRGAPAYIDGYAIPMNTRVDPELIFLAILAATDLESMNAAAEFGLVTRADATNPNAPRNALAAATSLVEGRGADSPHPAAGIARAKIGEALLTILDGVSPEDALAAAQAAYIAEATEQGLL